MVRASLIVLALLTALGLVFTFLPSPAPAPRDSVVLEGVDLVLYPAADQNARWTFSASEVRYDPDTHESVVERLSDGRRLVKDKAGAYKVDLTIRTSRVTIDPADNLNTQQAEIYIPESCIRLKLGKPAPASPVVIDQTSGYRAPSADITFTNFRMAGDNLAASFDLETFQLVNTKTSAVQGGSQRCVNGQIVRNGS